MPFTYLETWNWVSSKKSSGYLCPNVLDELGFVSWTVSLEPTEAGGPHDTNVTLVADSTVIILTNVMFGDVYFCSGQSIMVWSVDTVRKLYNNYRTVEFTLKFVL